MRLRFRHTLGFRFADPARNVSAILRLTPRSHEGQRITNWRINVTPDCLLRAGEDHFGNITHRLTVQGPVTELSITAEGELTSFDALGVVRGSAERLPVELYCRDTGLTAAGADLRAFAVDVTHAADNPIGKLHQLLGAIHQEIAVSDFDFEARSADEAFQAKSGDPRDHANIFAACARSLDIPARCVAGYLLSDVGNSRRHVWAEAYVDGLGWVGFDPVHDICPQDRHVRVAVGLDGLEASVFRGSRAEPAEETFAATWLFGQRGDSQTQSQTSG